MSLNAWTAHYAALDAMQAQKDAAQAVQTAASWRQYASKLEAQNAQLSKQLKKTIEGNACNLAEKVVLRQALIESNPFHPMVADFVNPTPENVQRGKFMRELIQKEAAKVMNATNNYDEVRAWAQRVKF